MHNDILLGRCGKLENFKDICLWKGSFRPVINWLHTYQYNFTWPLQHGESINRVDLIICCICLCLSSIKYLKHYKLISSSTKAEKIRWILLCVLHGENDQQEHINESTDEEAKEGGTEDNSKDIDNSGEEKSEEDIVLTELSSGPDSEQDATSGKWKW